jgi:hypothetical protein
VTVVASAGVALIVARILNYAARRSAFLCPLHHPVSMILTFLPKVDEVQLRMKGWQGRGCRRKVRLSAGHAVLDQGWMTSKMRYLVGEETAEACCAMRMREARMGAQRRLDSENRFR